MTAQPSAGRPTGRVVSEPPLASGNDGPTTTTVETVSVFPPTALPPDATVVPSVSTWARGKTDQIFDDSRSRGVHILQSLSLLRLMTGAQIQRLHFYEGSPATQGRRARAAIQQLAERRLIVRLDRRVGGIRAGSSGYVLGLSGHGQALLEVEGPLGGRRRRVWETSPSFRDHVLAVSDTYVSLTEGERRGELELLEFQAEPPCWRDYPDRSGRTLTLKPDAFARLGVGDFERSAFIELDRGTESPATLTRKCQAYIAYFRTGLEQRNHGVFPSVLWLGTNARSVGRITDVVHRLPAEVRHLFQVAPHDGAIRILTDTAEAGRRG